MKVEARLDDGRRRPRVGGWWPLAVVGAGLIAALAAWWQVRGELAVVEAKLSKLETQTQHAVVQTDVRHDTIYIIKEVRGVATFQNTPASALAAEKTRSVFAPRITDSEGSSSVTPEDIRKLPIAAIKKIAEATAGTSPQDGVDIVIKSTRGGPFIMNKDSLSNIEANAPTTPTERPLDSLLAVLPPRRLQQADTSSAASLPDAPVENIKLPRPKKGWEVQLYSFALPDGHDDRILGGGVSVRRDVTKHLKLSAMAGSEALFAEVKGFELDRYDIPPFVSTSPDVTLDEVKMNMHALQLGTMAAWHFRPEKRLQPFVSGGIVGTLPFYRDLRYELRQNGIEFEDNPAAELELRRPFVNAQASAGVQYQFGSFVTSIEAIARPDFRHKDGADVGLQLRAGWRF